MSSPLTFPPVVSIVIGALILAGSFRIIWESAQVLLEAAPAGVHTAKVQQEMLAVPGVRSVHDLHIWAMSTTQTALTAHLVMGGPPRDDGLLAQVTSDLRARFTIEHATLQVECGDAEYPCALAPSHLV